MTHGVNCRCLLSAFCVCPCDEGGITKSNGWRGPGLVFPGGSTVNEPTSGTTYPSTHLLEPKRLQNRSKRVKNTSSVLA
eukprot:8678108-Karenia_brevis.AAC.1